MPSTEKFTIAELAPPSAMLPELSCCTFGESDSAARGLVVVARLFSGKLGDLLIILGVADHRVLGINHGHRVCNFDGLRLTLHPERNIDP
jgi:hypothetical protein